MSHISDNGTDMQRFFQQMSQFLIKYNQEFEE